MGGRGSAIFVFLMTRPLRFQLLWAIAAISAAFAQRPGLDRIRINDLRADLTFLASDALEGRRSLQRGSEVAIQFLAAEFSKAGLEPVAGDSYLQPVPLIEYRVDASQTGLALEHASKRRDLKYGVDFFGGSAFEAAVQGPVAFAGKGNTRYSSALVKVLNAKKHGAIGVLFVAEPNRKHPSPQERTARIPGSEQRARRL